MNPMTLEQHRRDFLKSLLAGAAVSYGTVMAKPTEKLGLPGPYPGRVIAIEHSGSIIDGKFQRPAIHSMMDRGMMNLTGAPSPQDAWRSFFEPGDVVGIKLNPVGRPDVISSPETVNEIIAGLQSAGVPLKNIVAYDRYKREFLEAGFDKWLPEGVRWTYGTDKTHPLQLDMDMYDEKEYVEMPLVQPDADPNNPHHRRSYLAKFITKDVNKLVNLCMVKHHQSAGVTISLKNISHGHVNNVARSHSSPSLNTCGTFIPNVVDHPVFRKKVVLNICDGVLAAYHGGPGRTVSKYKWEHKTMYFATDPVALDKTALKVIDAKRAEVGRLSIANAKPDEDSRFVNMQPEHIEIAGALGLGTFDDKKIDVRRVKLA
jgi:uncharacterized protein (DUF362 family)